jgi:HAD superfamily hydrolase (TIGR01509 family)
MTHSPLAKELETMFRAVIFDVDGTLVDSNDAHARAWAEAMAESGWQVPVERIRPLIGMGGDKLLPRLTGIDAESVEGKAMTTRRGTIFRERYLPLLKPTRGAESLLEKLHGAGMQLVVASSATADELEDLLRAAGATQWIKTTTSSDDAERSKPDPDIVRAALDTINYQPEEAVMIGDTPYDITAAARAGIGTIALRSGGWSDGALINALAVYQDPQDLLDHYDRSPFVRCDRAPSTSR